MTSMMNLQRAVRPLGFRRMSSAFESAQESVKRLKDEPDNATKLRLYALYKQATIGDASNTKRPGALDFVNRAKYDAWMEKKGLSQDEAKSEYVKLVNELHGAAPTTQSSPNTDEGIRVQKEGKISRITLNRPAKKNALNYEMYHRFITALHEANKDTTTAITVIDAVGDYFSSGNDLSNFTNIKSPAEIPAMANAAKDVLTKFVAAFIEHDKPLIALVNGPAIGVMVTTLGLYDLVLASDKATFVTPFASLGQSPEGCSSLLFPLIMGPAKAAEVLIFGRKLSAQEAMERNLVNEVFPHAVFRAETQRRIEAFSQLPPQSMRLSKQIIRNQMRSQLRECNHAEVELLGDRWQSEECMHAIQTFFRRK